MKKLILFLLLLAGCTKEQTSQHMVQLSVDGNGSFTVTYGTSNLVTENSQANWTSILNAETGDTIHLKVQTLNEPATIYMQVEVREALLYFRSMYIEPNSSGTLHYILD